MTRRANLHIANIRLLSPRTKAQVRRLFQNMLDQSGYNVTMTDAPGELFAVLSHGRVAGGVWIRTWPSQRHIGDVHIASSRYRFRHYDTLVAFDLLLRERATIMGLKEWRVVVSAEDQHVLDALTYLKFEPASRQAFPGIKDAIILSREVT